MTMLWGCGSKNQSEVDGEEFEVDTLEALIEVLEKYREVHLNYFQDSKDELDLWVKLE